MALRVRLRPTWSRTARQPTGRETVGYDAFLSYNRAVDRQLAPALQRALHQLAKPWYRTRVLRVFRDDASLSANPHLWRSIQDALDSSRFFILLASPESAQSRWVEREVEHWLGHKPPANVLIVLTDGVVAWDVATGDFDWDQTTAAPSCLQGVFDQEPRWVDFRWARTQEHLSLRDPRFRDGVADLAAPLHGRPKDELFGEDVRQHRRTLRWVRGTVAVLAALALLASAAAVVAVRQSNTARARAAIAEARQYAAEAQSAADPYAAVALAVAAEQRTGSPLPEARAAFAAAAQRASSWTTRLVGGLAGGALTVDALTWSAAGSQVLIAVEDGSVRRWDVRSGESARVLSPTPGMGPVSSSASWAANRTTVAMVRSGGKIVVRDLRSPDAQVALFKGGDVWYGGLSPDGRTLAAGDGNGAVHRWDARTGRTVGPLLRGPRGFLRHVAWSPDGSHLAEVATGLQIWEVANGRALRASAAGEEGWSLAWSPDGSRLAVGGEHGAVRLWDGRTGRAVGDLVGHAGRVWDLAWSPDRRYLASAGEEGTIRLWDLADGKPVGQPLSLDGETPAVRLAWSPDSRLLVGAFGLTQSSPQVLRLWRVAKPRPDARVMRGGSSQVGSLAWSPDGRYVAGGDGSGTVWIWDPRTGGRVAALPPDRNEDEVTSVAWSADGRRLAGGSTAGIRGWTAVQQAPPEPWWASGGAITVAWSPDGTRLASGDNFGAVRVWDAATRRPAGRALTVGSRTEVVRWISWSPDGSRLAVGLESGGVERLDVASGRRLGTRIQASSQIVRTMAWSPSGEVLAAGGDDGTIRLWQAGTGRPIHAMKAADVVVEALAWSADGTRLASGGSSGTVQVWDAASGVVLGRAAAQSSGVASLTWSPDGRELASGGPDGTVRLWRATSERQACQEARGELELTQETRSASAVGLDVCSHPGSVRDLLPIPVLPASKGSR